MKYRIKEKLRTFLEGGKNLQASNMLPLEVGADLIYDLLNSSKPCVIARYGATELEIIVRYLTIQRQRKMGLGFLLNNEKWKGSFGWEQRLLDKISDLSGVFSNTPEEMERFCELVLEDSKEIDILGSWKPGENKLQKYWSKDIQIVPLRAIEPYYVDTPWTRVLEGKKVLVVHPFQETIESQFKKRALLFEDQRMLPAFDLKTIKAVQSLVGEPVPFDTWFDALDSMKQQISATDFDIAIIGCGAYAMHLAAHVKRMGKQAIHMGGATQILFGIKGRRWDDHEVISKLYNESWTTASASETPQKSNKVEDSCYW